MTTNDGSVLKRGNRHLAILAAVPVWEGTVVYPRASIFLDERDHGCSKDFVRDGGCRPELPIYQWEYRWADQDGSGVGFARGR